MNVKPMGDRVLVEPVEAETVTPGGVILAEIAVEKSQRGTVVALGNGRRDDGTVVSIDLTVGAEVLYSRYGGTEVTVDGETLLLLRETDILAVFE